MGFCSFNFGVNWWSFRLINEDVAQRFCMKIELEAWIRMGFELTTDALKTVIEVFCCLMCEITFKIILNNVLKLICEICMFWSIRVHLDLNNKSKEIIMSRKLEIDLCRS